jgi:hypothetical protein
MPTLSRHKEELTIKIQNIPSYLLVAIPLLADPAGTANTARRGVEGAGGKHAWDSSVQQGSQ